MTIMPIPNNGQYLKLEARGVTNDVIFCDESLSFALIISALLKYKENAALHG
jgi:hypothetical protein